MALDQYEDEPDAVVDEIHRQTGLFDLKLHFGDRGELARFLHHYEAVVKATAAA